MVLVILLLIFYIIINFINYQNAKKIIISPYLIIIKAAD